MLFSGNIILWKYLYSQKKENYQDYELSETYYYYEATYAQTTIFSHCLLKSGSYPTFSSVNCPGVESGRPVSEAASCNLPNIITEICRYPKIMKEVVLDSESLWKLSKKPIFFSFTKTNKTEMKKRSLACLLYGFV